MESQQVKKNYHKQTHVTNEYSKWCPMQQVPCLGEKCAWWLIVDKQCAMKSIGYGFGRN